MVDHIDDSNGVDITKPKKAAEKPKEAKKPKDTKKSPSSQKDS